MQPVFIEGLEFVKSSFHSVHGRIESNWSRDGDKIEWDITVPANTTAKVCIPATRIKEITENGKSLRTAYGINRIRKESGYIYIETGSGNYHFVFTHETAR